MSDFNTVHLRNVNIQNIVLQNQELRRHLQHYLQNQHLMSEVMHKLQLSKAKEIELINANGSLNDLLKKQQITANERQNTYSEQMQYVFVQHDKIIAGKDHQINYLKQELSKITQRLLQSQEIASHHQERERQLTQKQQHQLSKYKNNILQFEREIQTLYKNAENQRYSFEKAKSSWNLESQNYISQVSKLSELLKKKEEDNCLFLDYSKQLQSNLIKVEQQNRATLVQLRDRLIRQEEQIQHYLYLNKQLQSSNQIITRQIQQLKRLQAHLSNDNNGLTQQNERMITLLNQSHRQSQFLRSQITELQIQISRTVENNELQLQALRAQKLQLLRSKTQVDSYINSKISQLRQVSASANSLQTLASKQQLRIENLTHNTKDLQQYLLKQKKRVSQLSIQLKQQYDSNSIIKQQNARLEEINNKLQQQIHQLSNQAMNLSKNLVNPRDLNKQFVEQMNKMLIKFRQERDQQSRYHVLQKQKLKERYEFQIKELELSLLKKIAILQQQVGLYKQYQILSQRNSNIYTYTSKLRQ